MSSTVDFKSLYQKVDDRKNANVTVCDICTANGRLMSLNIGKDVKTLYGGQQKHLQTKLCCNCVATYMNKFNQALQ